MGLSSFNINKILKNADERHKAFYFHFYTSNQNEFINAVERWADKKSDLKIILSEIQNNDINWHRKDILKHEKDLSGTEFKNIEFDKCIELLGYANLQYCSFDSCNFYTDIHDDSEHLNTVFLSCKLNHSFFKNCSFKNVSFQSGEFKNIVFYNCKFENVSFNKHSDGNYQKLFFQNCSFFETDFAKLNLNNSCFWGDCEYHNIIYSDLTFSIKKIIGKEILDLCKLWDNESFLIRKRNKYIGGPQNKMEIVYFQENEEEEKIIKYSSLNNCYSGLLSLYKYLYLYEDKNGDHLKYLYFNFIFRWLDDQILLYKNGLIEMRHIFISRYVLGYGVKYGNTLRAYLYMILLFAYIYMFIGVKQGDEVIIRHFSLDFSQISNTLYDFYRCSYYALITGTTTGYGDILPLNSLGMFLAGFQAMLGILLTTMFTVIFGRRFFK